MSFWSGPDIEEPDPDNRVTIARFSSPLEAQMARGLLESVGIESFLVGENVNNLLQAAFRVRLQVAAADEDAARELLPPNTELPA